MWVPKRRASDKILTARQVNLKKGVTSVTWDSCHFRALKVKTSTGVWKQSTAPLASEALLILAWCAQRVHSHLIVQLSCFRPAVVSKCAKLYMQCTAVNQSSCTFQIQSSCAFQAGPFSSHQPELIEDSPSFCCLPEHLAAVLDHTVPPTPLQLWTLALREEWGSRADWIPLP